MWLLETVVKRQRTEEDLAFIGLGKLRIDEKFIEVGMKESVFYRKTRAQQEARLGSSCEHGGHKTNELVESFNLAAIVMAINS